MVEVSEGPASRPLPAEPMVEAVVGGLLREGFIASEDGLVVTCSHVLLSQSDQEAGNSPPETCQVELLSTRNTVTAKVLPEYWRAHHLGDFAILALPKGDYDCLTLVEEKGVKEEQFETYGFPRASEELPTDGRIMKQNVPDPRNPKGQELKVINSNDITSGFSGAPIVLKSSHLVSGVIVLINTQDENGKLANVAFAIPASTRLDS